MAYVYNAAAQYMLLVFLVLVVNSTSFKFYEVTRFYSSRLFLRALVNENSTEGLGIKTTLVFIPLLMLMYCDVDYELVWW